MNLFALFCGLDFALPCCCGGRPWSTWNTNQEDDHQVITQLHADGFQRLMLSTVEVLYKVLIRAIVLSVFGMCRF